MMNNIIVKVLISLLFFIGITNVVVAQNQMRKPSESAVSFGDTKISREEKDLVADYQITLGDNVLSCEVEVILKADGREVRYFQTDMRGDYGRITSSGQKQVRFNVENMKQALAGRDITFTFVVKDKNVLENNILAIASASVFPQLSYGLMAGYVRKIGGYVKFRSDFGSLTPAYECMSDGTVGDSFFWASGVQKQTRLQATAGMLFRASRSVFPYVGAGYGSRGVYWQDSEGEWAQVKDYSCKGISAEAGFVFKMGPVALSAGVSSTAFKYVEAEIGIGVMF